MPEFKVPDPAVLSHCKSPFPDPPNSCYNYNDIVTVRVREGVQHKDYQVFRELLRWHSAYFAAALDPDGSFDSGLGNLEIECEIEVFEVFYYWLHTSRLREPCQTDDKPNPKSIYLPALIICKVWIFADFRGIPELGNCAIDAFHESFVACWSTSTFNKPVKHVYNHTSEGSKLRACVSDIYVMSVSLANFQSSSQDNHTVSFLHDVLPGMTRATVGTPLGRKKLTAIDRCRWHNHSSPGGQLRLESRK